MFIFAFEIEYLLDMGFEFVMMEEAKFFVLGLKEAARKKVLYNVQRIASGDQNAELFKKLEGTEIWEFRTLYNGIHYRLFAFWDTENNTIVIATHGIIKKTQKTPKKEIAKAIEIRRRYFENKNKRL